MPIKIQIEQATASEIAEGKKKLKGRKVNEQRNVGSAENREG